VARIKKRFYVFYIYALGRGCNWNVQAGTKIFTYTCKLPVHEIASRNIIWARSLQNWKQAYVANHR